MEIPLLSEYISDDNIKKIKENGTFTEKILINEADELETKINLSISYIDKYNFTNISNIKSDVFHTAYELINKCKKQNKYYYTMLMKKVINKFSLVDDSYIYLIYLDLKNEKIPEILKLITNYYVTERSKIIHESMSIFFTNNEIDKINKMITDNNLFIPVLQKDFKKNYILSFQQELDMLLNKKISSAQVYKIFRNSTSYLQQFAFLIIPTAVKNITDNKKISNNTKNMYITMLLLGIIKSIKSNNTFSLYEYSELKVLYYNEIKKIFQSVTPISNDCILKMITGRYNCLYYLKDFYSDEWIIKILPLIISNVAYADCPGYILSLVKNTFSYETLSHASIKDIVKYYTFLCTNYCVSRDNTYVKTFSCVNFSKNENYYIYFCISCLCAYLNIYERKQIDQIYYSLGLKKENVYFDEFYDKVSNYTTSPITNFLFEIYTVIDNGFTPAGIPVYPILKKEMFIDILEYEKNTAESAKILSKNIIYSIFLKRFSDEFIDSFYENSYLQFKKSSNANIIKLLTNNRMVVNKLFEYLLDSDKELGISEKEFEKTRENAENYYNNLIVEYTLS